MARAAPRVPLPAGFLHRPFAHRGYHAAGDGRPENSRGAIAAAAAAGYGVEIDLQLSADGVAMVFHDATLGRMTAETGPVAARTAAALGAIPLAGGAEGIPTLAQVLDLVDGRVPLLIELKADAPGASAAALARAAAAALAGYAGPVALMSFDPGCVAACAHAAPHLPRGLTTCAFAAADWPDLDAATRAHRAAIADADATGAAFVSHDARDLGAPRLTELRQDGLTILCWTIRSPAAEAAARRVADQVTFEGYAA